MSDAGAIARRRRKGIMAAKGHKPATRRAAGTGRGSSLKGVRITDTTIIDNVEIPTPGAQRLMKMRDARARRAGTGNTIASRKAACAQRGLGWDAKKKDCSTRNRRGAGAKPRTRQVNTVRAGCHARGLAYHKPSNSCSTRPYRARGKNAPARAPRVTKKSVREDCHARGLNYHARSNKCSTRTYRPRARRS